MHVISVGKVKLDYEALAVAMGEGEFSVPRFSDVM